MRKNERVTLMALNQSGGIEKCDYKNINRRIAPLQEQICVDGIQRWWGKRAVPLNQGKIKHILEQQGIFTTNKMQKVNHRITRITANQCLSLIHI